jgi:hypothetical protein
MCLPLLHPGSLSRCGSMHMLLALLFGVRRGCAVCCARNATATSMLVPASKHGYYACTYMC